MGLTKEKLRRRRRQELKRRALFFGVPIVILLIVIYIIGAVYFSRHFYGKDTVFGIKIARQTTEALKEQIVEKVRGYQIRIDTRTGEEYITADETDLHFVDDGMLEALLKKQKALLWFTGVFGESEDIPIEMDYDEQLMDTRIHALTCMNEELMQKPVDAHLEFVDNAFQIVKEFMGTLLDTDKTAKVITNAIVNGEVTLNLNEAGCYTNPKVYGDSEELKDMLDGVNKLIDVAIVYDFVDRSETVDSAMIADWIYFGNDFAYELDWSKVELYVNELAKKYDTFGLSRKFTANSGRTVNLTGGDYGWLINKTATTEALMNLIQKGESVTTEPVYKYEAKSRRVNDIGNTYIEVSIAQQRMWCYVDGVCIVDTPVVTGTETVEERKTPRGGVWSIDAKMVDYTLVGEDYDSHVDYWLPFNGNVGVHDADWRTEFGGSIYQLSGSHGCVNTPYAAAKKIYNNVTIGTPVIVY